MTERAQTLILSLAGRGLPFVPEFDEGIGRFYQGTLPHPDTSPYSQLSPRSLLTHDVFEKVSKVLT
jgi:hypothetical protein